MNLKRFVTIVLVLFSAVFSLQAQEKKTIERPAYILQHYASMTIDSSDEDFDFDSYFTLNTTSDNGTVNFFIFEGAIDSKDAVQKQIDAFLSHVVTNEKVTKYTNWGSYKGQGAIIKGTLMKMLDGEVKIFAYAGEKYSFLVVSQILEEDREKDTPGLKLIESTFKLK
jgi:hypothetical protein